MNGYGGKWYWNPAAGIAPKQSFKFNRFKGANNDKKVVFLRVCAYCLSQLKRCGKGRLGRPFKVNVCIPEIKQLKMPMSMNILSGILFQNIILMLGSEELRKYSLKGIVWRTHACNLSPNGRNEPFLLSWLRDHSKHFSNSIGLVPLSEYPQCHGFTNP